MNGVKKQKHINIVCLFAMIIVIAFILLSLMGRVDVFCERVVSHFGGEMPLDGDGTLESPYLIYSQEDLQYLSDTVRGGNTYSGMYFSLQNDIFLDAFHKAITIGYLYDLAFDENTIVEDGYRFAGFFMGNGHKIEGLEIDNPEGHAGLFTGLAGTVSDLAVQNATVKGKRAGIIASSVSDKATIENCFASGLVSGSELADDKNSTVGLIAGSSSGVINNCIACASTECDITTVTGTFEDGTINCSFVKIEKESDELGRNSGGVCYCDKNQNEYTIDEVNDILYDNLVDLKYDIPHKTWEKYGGRVVLSKENSPLFTRAWLEGGVVRGENRIEGFYSLRDKIWYFVLPKQKKINESDKGEGSFTLKFANSDGEYDIPIDNLSKEYDFSRNGFDYKVAIVSVGEAPAIFVDTDAQNGFAYLLQTKEHNVSGNMSVLDVTSGDDADYRVKKISCRGNDSFQASHQWKNGYKFELDVRSSVLGLPANEDYVLISGYRNNSLLSYMLEKDLYKHIGYEFAQDYRLVHFYLDGTYMGLYMLTGSQEIDKGRFDIEDSFAKTQFLNDRKLSEYEIAEYTDEDTGVQRVWYDIPNVPKDITGGYLMELNLEDYTDRDSRFITKHGTSVCLKSNKYAAKAQVDYLADFWDDFEEALYAEDGYNSKGKYYADYIDLKSMADLCLAIDVDMNNSLDGSIYFYKDADCFSDGKMYVGQHWDCEHIYMYSADDDAGTYPCYAMNPKSQYGFWNKLYTHDDFVRVAKREWTEKIKPAYEHLISDDPTTLGETLMNLNEYVEKYDESFAINNLRWEDADQTVKADSIADHIRARLDKMPEYYEQ